MSFKLSQVNALFEAVGRKGAAKWNLLKCTKNAKNIEGLVKDELVKVPEEGDSNLTLWNKIQAAVADSSLVIVDDTVAETPAPKSRKTGEKKKPGGRKKTGTNGDGISCLDAVIKVLGGKKEPMSAPELLIEIDKKGLWKSSSKNPTNALWGQIWTDIHNHGKKSRFKKVGRGKFALSGK